MPVQVLEIDTELVVIADLPGFDQSDICIEAEKQDLFIIADRSTVAGVDGSVVRNERSASVERTVRLPTAVLVDSPTVEFDNGVLRLEFDKHAQNRRVTIDL